MAEQTFLEWRNNNQNVNYPFSDLATLRNTENVTLDRDLFADARLYPIGGDYGLYLSRIHVTASVLTFWLADSTEAELAYASFDFTNDLLIPNDLAVTDLYGRPAGILVSTATQLRLLSGQYPAGDTLFTADQTPFASTVIIPTPQLGVRGFLLDDGQIVADNVCLVGSEGVVLRLEDGCVRVDVVGDAYAFQKACENEGFPQTTFCGIKTINGIAPDRTGNFWLSIGGNVTQDNILRINQTPGVLQIKALGTVGFQNG